MKKVILYIHGKDGSYKEADQYRKICDGFDVVGVDYNDYFPWVAQDDIKTAYNELRKEYERIYIIANSIGAYFAMHTLQKCEIEKALFISPILDMERLILDMMQWANVTEQELCEKGEIPTDFGETLSWEYLNYVRENSIDWKIRTEILFAGKDNFTSRKTVDIFVENHNAALTVMENGEHWFHTDEQLDFLYKWVRNVI